MSTDSQKYRDREPPKRKARDDPDGVILARKKQHRKAHDSYDEELSEDYGSGDGINPKFYRTSKAKSASRRTNDYPSVNELKKRIRDVKRLLRKADLPADARIVQERALAGYEQDLAQETARRQRSEMIKRYHFVRFLDRKTAAKELNRLLRRDKEQDLDSKRKADLRQRIHVARVNLNYTIYYPLTEKYISLYPKSQRSTSDGTNAESASESESRKHEKKTDDAKPMLWPVVAKCMEEGTLDLLREGKLNIAANGEKRPVSSGGHAAAGSDGRKSKTREGQKEHIGASRKQRHVSGDGMGSKRDKPSRREQQERMQEARPEDESDGGFFEE